MFEIILRTNLDTYEQKQEGKDQDSIQSSTTPDPGLRMGKSDKNTRKHHIQESQEVSPFPIGDHKNRK